MDNEEDKLKQLWNEPLPHSDTRASLRTVLQQASKMTGVKDVASLFVGWLWVVFMGFGASIYSAKRKFESHTSSKPHQNKSTK